MTTFTTAFNIGDYVTIVMFDLNYRGRVAEIRLDGGPPYFKVCYARDGEICRDEFTADELVRTVTKEPRA